jgi:TPR repeat protein
VLTVHLALALFTRHLAFKFLPGRALSLGNNRLEAIKYYLDTADRGHVGTRNDLGGISEYGVGVSKNLETMLAWYETAAKLGHSGSMDHLGRLNENGLDVLQDFARAKYWYENAAALGNAVSVNNQILLLLRAGTSRQPSLAFQAPSPKSSNC